MRNNTLEHGDGGYGLDRFSCDMIQSMFLEVKAELGLVCTGGDGDGGVWSLKLESLQGCGFKWAELFVMPDLPKDAHGHRWAICELSWHLAFDLQGGYFLPTRSG